MMLYKIWKFNMESVFLCYHHLLNLFEGKKFHLCDFLWIGIERAVVHSFKNGNQFIFSLLFIFKFNQRNKCTPSYASFLFQFSDCGSMKVFAMINPTSR